MQIVTDGGSDLAPEQVAGLDIYKAPLRFTLDGRTYISEVDIQPDEFYRLLEGTDSFPTTSQPSAGEFAELYRTLAKKDPEILSIHISSGLSGTLNAARAGAEMVPEAKVTFWDSRTLSCPEGWQVLAAARAARAGWTLDKILPVLNGIRERCEGMFTLTTLKYLVHGGRISHLKGLIASLLNIKPIIGVEKEHGVYISHGQDVTLKRAINRMANQVLRWYPEGSKLRIQPLHANNPEGVEYFKSRLESLFDCVWEPLTPIAPVLGAHTGPGLVGLAVGPWELFEGLP